MSDEEQFQTSLNVALEQLYNFGKALQKKCGKLIEENDNNIESDINCIEDVALKLVKTLQNSKGNILAALTFIENDIKQLNVMRESPLFQEVVEKIQESRTCSVVMENGNFVFKQPVDKGITVCLDGVVVNQDATTEGTSQIAGLQTHDEEAEDDQVVCESVPETKMLNLSLRKKVGRSDTEDTDDNWEDTLSRNGVKSEIKSELASNPSSYSLDIKEEPHSEESCKDAPVGVSSTSNTKGCSNPSNLDGAVPDSRLDPNVTDKNTEDDPVQSGGEFSVSDVKVAECLHQDGDDVESEDRHAPGDSQVKSEHAEEDIKVEHVDEGPTNGVGDDADSVWSNETILEEVNILDDVDANDDGGSLELSPTQTVRASPIEETGEYQNEEHVEEASPKTTELNDPDREVSESGKPVPLSSGDTLILENDSPLLSDVSSIRQETMLLSPERTGTGERVESDGKGCQVVQQEDDASDEHSNNKGAERNDAAVIPQDQFEEDTLSLDLVTQGDTSKDHASNSENASQAQNNGSSCDVSDIGRCDVKSLIEKHEGTDICEKDIADVKSQSEEDREDKETSSAEKDPSNANDDEITAMDDDDDTITIDDDSSDKVDSQKEQQMEGSRKPGRDEFMAESQSTTITPSDLEEELGEQNDDSKESDIEVSAAKDSGMQPGNISNMDGEGPAVVEGDASTEDTKTSFENTNDDQDHLQDDTSVVGNGIEEVSVTSNSNNGSDGKLQEDMSMSNLSSLDAVEDGHAPLKESNRIDESGEPVSQKVLGDAGGAIDVEKNKSSPQDTYTCKEILDAETITYDIAEALSGANIDEGKAREANDENDCEVTDVGNMDGHQTEIDSDRTHIESSQSTTKSQIEQNPTVTVDHITGNDQMVSASAEKNDVSHSRPESKLSECDSFVFDLQACSQNGSLDERGSGVEDDVKQADEGVAQKDADNALPDEDVAASIGHGRAEADLDDIRITDSADSDSANKQSVQSASSNEVASAESDEKHSNADEVVSDVEAVTNDDSEDPQLVDVVMEEILENSDNSAKDSANYSHVHKPETEISVKVELKTEEADPEQEEEEEEGDEGVESSGERREREEGDVGKLGDELLELFREVEINKDSEEHTNAKDEESSDDVLTVYESDDADAIFKAMEEDSTDTTDSDTVDDDDDDGDLSILDDSDIELLVENKVKYNDENSELKQNVMKALNLKERKMDRCYVRVERADLKKLSRTWRRTVTEDSIDRLCDLNTLNNKNAASSNGTNNEQPKSCHRKKRKKGDRSSDQSEDLFDSTSSSSDVEVWNDRSSSPEISVDVQKKLDIMLARVAMKGMQENSTDDSDTEHTDNEEERKRKKKKNGDREEAQESTAAQTKLTEEEKAKKKWRNDKLLREKLGSDDSSDSSTSSSSSGSSSSKRRKKKKYEDDDPDYKLDFNESSDRERRRTKLSHKDDNLKKSLSVSDDSSIEEKIQLDDTTDDSDVEFVFKDVACTSPELTLTPTQKGHRRNIRALMSDADLEEATLRAKEAEEERIGRLKSRQKLRENLSQSLSGTFTATSITTTDGEEQQEEEAAVVPPPLEEPLVLDVDENTNKPLVQVDPELTRILKSHQKAGVQFMWDCCYESLERIRDKDPGSGCILAHCMGLGKTLQVLTLIHTLFAYEQTGVKHVLVVCPLSTVSNWKKEVKLRLTDVKKNFKVFTIGSTQEINKQKPIIRQWCCAKRSILIMGYERYECLTNEEKLNKTGADFKTLVLNALVDPGPDLIVCDEGHLLRSKKAVKVQALNKVRTKRRIVLTGTPLQNNLIEYYHMVQFVKPNLLGNLKEFKTNFVNPITNGQYEDSTKEDIKLMKKRTHVLHNYLKQTIQRFEDTELQTYLKKMHHYAVFVQLHPLQVEFYKKFLDIAFEAQREEARKTSKQKGFLGDFAVFQYICTHPYLLQIMDKRRHTNEREQDVIITDDVRPECNVGKWWKDGMPADAENIIEYGTKLLVVRHILEECEEVGDKVLIFSQSLGELDLIEHFLKNTGTSKCSSWKKDVDYTRMDGTVKPESRSGICDRFNEKSNTKLRLLLISIRVGGLGLNLTAANRVITMTVSWNPSYDLQSVFRVYRFGQEKAVYVYRLIALDTMEEKAYQRTVTKLAVAHRVIDKYQIKRHYKSVDLQAMYSCYPTADKQRPTPNVPEDEVLAKLILKLPVIYKYHEQQALLANRPEDDLNEQEKIAAWEEFEKEKNVQKAAKEAAAMAATFAKEAAAASAEAMAALAATAADLAKTGGPIPITSRGPTFNTAYSLCPPTTSSGGGGTAAHGGDSTKNAAGTAGQNGVGGPTSTTFNQAYSFPPSNVVGSGDHLANDDGTRNANGQLLVANATTQGNVVSKNAPAPAVGLKFAKALEQLAILNNNDRIKYTGNRKPHNSAGVQWGGPPSGVAHARRFQQKPNKQQQPSGSRLSQQVDETPIDLTMDRGRDVVRGLPKDPLATCSNGTENVAGATVPRHWDRYHKSMEWMDRQKAKLIENLKNQNQKENQQQMVRPVKVYKRNRDSDAASKAAQMDHAYSATSIGAKRKSDHHAAVVGVPATTTTTTVPKKKRRVSGGGGGGNSSVMRVNPCALLQPASAQAVAAAAAAAASKTKAGAGAAPGGTINLSDDEVEVVTLAAPPPPPPSSSSSSSKPHHDDIINSLCRSGVTVTPLTPSDTTRNAKAAFNDVVITLE